MSAPAAPTGALAWGLNLLGIGVLPFLNLFLSGIVVTIVGITQSKRGGLARVNGRRAANWGLTVLLITLPCAAVYVTAIVIKAEGFFPWGIAIIIWGLLGVVNVIAGIIGLVQARAGREVRFPAIPFLR
ncbi:hypothetical protein B7R54_08610 [Subtercola boreus]|uniref:DUF4870 domain-containing protein n=1 Tax=Subtercola boreus TaxID=120213 RepID=A0A3E0VH61_9MICO|nr:hypothetical protein B7R54_08610 [Subtercola boreus]